MISRRQLLRTSCIGLAGAVAGCTGGDGTGSDQPSGEEESSSPGTDEPTGTPEPSYLTGTETVGTEIAVSVSDSETVSSVNAILGNGETFGSQNVNTGASQVSFQVLSGAPNPEEIVSPGTAFTFVAVNDSGEEIDSLDWTYQPRLTLAGAATGETEYPDYEKSEQLFVLEVENTGTGPALFDGARMTHLEDQDVNRVDEPIITDYTIGDEDHPAWFIPGYTTSWTTAHPPEYLDSGVPYDDSSNHIVPGGETRTFVFPDVFVTGFSYQNLDQQPDYERTYAVQPLSIPTADSPPAYEVTVEFSGEFKTFDTGASTDIWTSETQVLSTAEIDTYPAED